MVVLFLGLSSSANIKPNATDSNSPDNGRHEQAIALLRAINTAELNYQIKHGVYATWDSLVSNGDFTTQRIEVDIARFAISDPEVLERL
jgi:hypothetical protein